MKTFYEWGIPSVLFLIGVVLIFIVIPPIMRRAKEYVNKYLIIHEFIKRLHRRYQMEGIEIPFPIRTVYMKNGSSKD